VTLTSATRARDEMKLEYRFSSLDDALSTPMTTQRANAKVDREDLLTPLVERAAETIAASIRQR
jgi:hypothetical protein